jgi:hypothetical protein
MAVMMHVKISDIPNFSRPFEIADVWSDVVYEDF